MRSSSRSRAACCGRPSPSTRAPCTASRRAPAARSCRCRSSSPSSKVVLPIERRLNNVDDSVIRADLAALPAHLDQIDQYIADGVLNGEQPNAADLQIAPSIRLLYTLDDVRPLIEGRPAEAFTFRWFPQLPASVPAGALPVQAAAQAATLPAA